MKRKNLGIILTIFFVLTMIVAGCGASKKNSASGQPEAAENTSDGKAVADDAASEEEPNTSFGEAADEGAEAITPDREGQKLIRTYILDMETQEYEKLIPSVQKKIVSAGGYIESSNLEGNSYYDSGRRYAQIVARVPKENAESFVNTISELGNLINRTENTQDVTLAYTDVQSHQKTLKIEQERLLVLLEKAEKLEDIITLENRLSEVRFEIESYESKLRLYDNQVDYSTITLNISEVKRITAVDDETALDKMKSGFSNSIYNIRTGAVNFIVGLVVNIPYLIIWAVIIGAAIIVIRRVLRKKKKARETLPEDEEK